MPYNVSKQIQEAVERGDFKDLPGKGKPQQFDDNPYISPEVRMVNRMLKDKGFAPRWIEVDKEIRAETDRAEKIIENLKRRRNCLEAQFRAQLLKRDAIRSVFELERTRALEAYIVQLQQLNRKIQQWNLMMPLPDKQYPLHNLDAATTYFHKECPTL